MRELPTPYQSFIHLSRYSRYRDDLGRRETWDETVKRLIHFWVGRYGSDEIDYGKIHEIEDAILNLEIMPSMRSMMTAGPALERDHVAGYNPVAGDTRVVTKEHGNVYIRDLASQSATVLNCDGQWTSATFNSYGVQDTSTVKLRLNSNTRREIVTSNNHRWLLSDGTVKSTQQLERGDRINFVSAPKATIDEDYMLGVRHGIIYGDGTAIRSCERAKGYHIRLCGDSRELIEWFDGYPVCYPPSAGGDPVVMLYYNFSATHDLKSLPVSTETDSYLLGFIRGWMAADGHVTTRGSQVSLCVAKEGLEWLERFSEREGFVIQRVYKQNAKTNYGKRKQDRYVVYFSRSSMSSEDLLCSWKKDSFKELESIFVVTEVEATDNKEEVFCAEVPDTNTFVLEGGLVTGNCSYLPIENPRCFDELMYILLCGTGVGFSVERQYVNKLPEVSDEFHETDTTIVVADSKIGWASAFRELVSLLYSGKVPKWDMSRVRPAGARLVTFGGRASGQDPLEDLFKFSVDLFKKAAGRRFTSLECHDLVCKIADIVVVGGVRRSALISLSNLSDDRMRGAKNGQWWLDNPQRALANNSYTSTERPSFEVFLAEWNSLYESKSGERGIFSREACKRKAEENGRRDPDYEWGSNPCNEIILRPYGLCNLSEVVVRQDDTLEDLKRKVRLATILGTLQSSLTDFRYLRKKWRDNCEEERLLGVSLTGICDHPVISQDYIDVYSKKDDEIITYVTRHWLEELRDVAIETNKEWADKLGINPSTAITCVKPSGTVSQLVNSASGIHPRYSRFYIRRVRNDKKDPLSQFLIDSGVPYEEDKMNPQTYVFSFPIKAPESAVVAGEMTAMQQLDLWKVYAKHYCEHKPSMTCYYKDDEFLQVGQWVWDNFKDISGISFLPYTDHTYQQAPYEPINEDTYNKLVKEMPVDIDWTKLQEYESEDTTTGAQELACAGGACEID